ncbi:MAG: hypothetical protein OEQ18_10985, partial [Gammaproteobacteria bacterium]|nr:hypothetical protein [Gammaproteobacteria bacterium]
MMLTLNRLRLVIGGYLLVLASSVCAVSGDGWEVENKGDPDYAAAANAVEREDWTNAVAALRKVITRRDWDDD